MNVHSIFDDARKRRTARAEQTRARCAAYHLAPREDINARSRAFNTDNIIQKQRAYNISHRDATNARQRAAYRKDIDAVRARYREYVAKHRGSINARKRAKSSSRNLPLSKRSTPTLHVAPPRRSS